MTKLVIDGHYFCGESSWIWQIQIDIRSKGLVRGPALGTFPRAPKRCESPVTFLSAGGEHARMSQRWPSPMPHLRWFSYAYVLWDTYAYSDLYIHMHSSSTIQIFYKIAISFFLVSYFFFPSSEPEYYSVLVRLLELRPTPSNSLNKFPYRCN